MWWEENAQKTRTKQQNKNNNQNNQVFSLFRLCDISQFLRSNILPCHVWYDKLIFNLFLIFYTFHSFRRFMLFPFAFCNHILFSLPHFWFFYFFFLCLFRSFASILQTKEKTVFRFISHSLPAQSLLMTKSVCMLTTCVNLVVFFWGETLTICCQYH